CQTQHEMQQVNICVLLAGIVKPRNHTATKRREQETDVKDCNDAKKPCHGGAALVESSGLSRMLGQSRLRGGSRSIRAEEVRLTQASHCAYFVAVGHESAPARRPDFRLPTGSGAIIESTSGAPRGSTARRGSGRPR